MSSSRGKKIAVPASKKRKGASSSVGPTAKICHPLLQFPRGPTYSQSPHTFLSIKVLAHFGSKASVLPPSLSTRDSAPDEAASEEGHLHWPLCDSAGVTLRAPQHCGPRIIPHPHQPDVSIRYLEHAEHEDDREAPRNLPSSVSSCPIYPGGGLRGHS
ncbi:hypothetical protein GOBAR_AA36087 [Gossypium barbadense]|uniref:Uncharacterized protein n=1 Tax=Gossypium barbadense TaxID=3634 RepID=A0A2P5W0L2_GOSBA|nr:hypothetical protein GOBAR_AA36087 [Gossypium barbadense]